MSEEQLKAFLEKVKGDTSLQEKLKAAADSDAVTAIAKEAGFSISLDDFNKSSELLGKELEGVVGGNDVTEGTFNWPFCINNAISGAKITINLNPYGICDQ